MAELMSSVPGIDEAMAFAELMKMVCSKTIYFGQQSIKQSLPGD